MILATSNAAKNKYPYTFLLCHVLLPILIMASSFVQVVRNFGRRIAAAINSGSPNMWPKRFFIPTCRTSTRGLQYFNGSLTLSSLVVSRLIVGSNHPIWIFASACKMLVAWETGLVTAALLCEECDFSWTEPAMKTKSILFYNNITISSDLTEHNVKQ